MSSESKTQDWSKPAAMAIPKGGYFGTRSSRGVTGESPPTHLLAFEETAGQLSKLTAGTFYSF